MKTYTMGILGCGDFLRWQAPAIRDSANIRVKSLYDPDGSRAEKFAASLGGAAVDDAGRIFDDPEIEIVTLLVPPWVRKDMTRRAVESGKHVIGTKPLAPTVAEAEEIVRLVGDRVRCGLVYGRTGSAEVDTLRRIFTSGEIGKMALYKQDWLHHYPSWNNWALDPEKNGGPFMDAMIHNLNAAKFLAGGMVKRATFFSDRLAHPDLKCADTEGLKIDFAPNATAYLFVTWAADLAVHSTDGNNREHIDILYLITDRGWRLTRDKRDGQDVFVASRDGREKVYPVVPDSPEPTYQRFARALEKGKPMPDDFVDPAEAAQDISLILSGK